MVYEDKLWVVLTMTLKAPPCSDMSGLMLGTDFDNVVSHSRYGKYLLCQEAQLLEFSVAGT